MRTVIFFGLVYIGDAIGSPIYMSEGEVNVPLVMGIIMLVAIVMDITEFIRKSA